MLEVLLQASPSGQKYWAFFLEAFSTTVLVSVFSAVAATSLALLIASLAHRHNKLALGFIEVFRNIPLIVQVFVAFYVLPMTFTPLLKLTNTSQILVLGTLALTLYMSARISAQLLSGLCAIKHGQIEACKTLGLSNFSSYRHVLLPIAFRTTMPSLTNEWAATVKNSSVISTIGLIELTKSSQIFIEYTSLAYLAFGISIAGYLLVNSALVYASHRLNRKIAIKGQI